MDLRKETQRSANILILRSFEHYMVCCSSLKERFVRIIVVICSVSLAPWKSGNVYNILALPLSLSPPLVFIRQIRR